jgi:hypothetical protein
MWLRNACFLLLCALGLAAVAGSLLPRDRIKAPPGHSLSVDEAAEFRRVVDQIDAEFQQHWQDTQLSPAQPADHWTVIRRLSLALTGTIPSLEEVRALEQIAESQRVDWWLDRLLQDRRYSDYLAERLARAYVGTEDGPFLIFRRRRFVSWLSDQIHQNRRYDELVRDLVSGVGLWTDSPQVNFITVTTDVNGDEQPDEERLAARTARAFLGVRLDCVQCHDDNLGGDWVQSDFQELAAFFRGAKSTAIGIQDEEAVYEFQYLGHDETVDVEPSVPFREALDVQAEADRSRLADWITHSDNDIFRRAIVNRMWALMLGKPLVDPIDDIPLEGPYPPGLVRIADDFGQHDFDLQRLIRLIAHTRAFRVDSRVEGGASYEQECQWAVFPVTRLRPEQMAGSLLQASSLKTIDANSHILVRLSRYEQGNEFVQRYGDRGEDEFGEGSGTIPQRLLMMNGQLVQERTKDDLIGNAVTRIAALAKDDERAIDSAYLAVLTRLPTPAERDHFLQRMEEKDRPERRKEMEDLYWTLFNCSEFSWNH